MCVCVFGRSTKSYETDARGFYLPPDWMSCKWTQEYPSGDHNINIKLLIIIWHLTTIILC